MPSDAMQAPAPAADKNADNRAPTAPPVIDAIPGQPRVREFFARALAEGRLSHAYLFVGAPGSGQLEAARAVAQAAVCRHGGCGVCDDCVRVAHGTHPDVTFEEPGSAKGYVADQVRAVIEAAPLAPVRAQRKVYVLDRADRLTATTANALLKTIEEPPEGAIFILVAPSVDTVLPTIASRCQQVPFRAYAPEQAAAALAAETGADERAALLALSVAGSPAAARGFLSSDGAHRREARNLMARALVGLKTADPWGVLCSAKAVVDAALNREDPLAGPIAAVKPLVDAAKKAKQLKPREARDVNAALDAVLENKGADNLVVAATLPFVEQAAQSGAISRAEAALISERLEACALRATEDEYLTAGAVKERELRAKRQLNAKELSSIMETIAGAEVLLRDVLIAGQGVGAAPVCYDLAQDVRELAAATDPDAVLRALEACEQARANIRGNETPRLALEVMLLDIKEALWLSSSR